MEAEFKSLALVLKTLDSDDPSGEFEAILSTPQLDRDGETVETKAFDPLPKSLPIHYAHDWLSGNPPIGVGEPFYDGDVLKIKGRFAPTERAQEFRTLVNGGFITSMSAGFNVLKRKGKSILKGDLFEGSLTATPVNVGALVLASKSMRPVVKAGARNSSTDSTRLQQIHDLSVENGAACTTTKSLKSIEGSVEALQDRVRDALEDAYGEWSTYLRGVLPDLVVFDWFAGDGDTYQQSYADDGAVVTLTGTAAEVDVHEIVVPDADADREQNEGPQAPMMLSIKPPAAHAASEPDPASAAADEEMERQRQRVRAWQLTA